MTLEEKIRQLAKSGRLNYLSLAHTENGWEAYYRGVDDNDKRHAVNKDAVAAMAEALGARVEKAAKSEKPEKPVKPAPPAAKKYDPTDDL